MKNVLLIFFLVLVLGVFVNNVVVVDLCVVIFNVSMDVINYVKKGEVIDKDVLSKVLVSNY